MKRKKVGLGALSDAIILPMLPASSSSEHCQGADAAPMQAKALSPRVPLPTTSSSSSSISALEIFAPKDSRAPLESNTGSSSAQGENTHTAVRGPLRAFYITKRKHVARYGISPGCGGCLFNEKHTIECRERMEGAVMADPEMDTEVGQFVERHLQRHDDDASRMGVERALAPDALALGEKNADEALSVIPTSGGSQPSSLKRPRSTPKLGPRQRINVRFAKGRRRSGYKKATPCRNNGAPLVEDDWLSAGASDLKGEAGCKVDKEQTSRAARRVTGGLQTFTLQCGMLVDFCELLRGESLQLVYAMLLLLVGRLKQRGFEPKAIFYDNACKLLAVARAKRSCYPPLTELFADIKILLDKLHRGNHTWCLENLPEVDCCRPEMKQYTDGVDTQACEQLNSFISDCTPPALEMKQGRYLVWWSSLFRLKNDRTFSEREKARARFARGHMKNDPDKVRQGATA